MAIQTGRYAKATFGTTTIADMASISMNTDTPVVTFEAFGDTNSQVAGTGIISTAGSLSGALNLSDTDGQLALYNACISGTNITDFRIYVNATDYWTSNTVEDADAHCRFTNFNITAAPAETVTVSSDFTFSGKVHLTS